MSISLLVRRFVPSELFHRDKYGLCLCEPWKESKKLATSLLDIQDVKCIAGFINLELPQVQTEHQLPEGN